MVTLDTPISQLCTRTQRFKAPRGYVKTDPNERVLETLSHARSLVNDPFNTMHCNPQEVLQTQSSPGQWQPTSTRQYDCKTVRASLSPSKLAKIKEASSRDPGKSIIHPSVVDVVVASSQTSLKSLQQQSTSPSRNPCSSHLKALFIPPISSLNSLNLLRSVAVTKPRAPLLLTQLRAQRHKTMEKLTKSSTETMGKKSKKCLTGIQTPSYSDNAPMSPSTSNQPSPSKSEPGLSNCRQDQNSYSNTTKINAKRKPIANWQSKIVTGSTIATPITGHSKNPNSGPRTQSPVSVIHFARSRRPDTPPFVRKCTSIHHPSQLDPLDLLPALRNRIISRTEESFCSENADNTTSDASSANGSEIDTDSSLTSVIRYTSQVTPSYSKILATPLPPLSPSYSQVVSASTVKPSSSSPQVSGPSAVCGEITTASSQVNGPVSQKTRVSHRQIMETFI
jgi:hypothetical protein